MNLSEKVRTLPSAWDGIETEDHPTTAEPPPPVLTRQSLAAWHFAQMAGDRVRYDHGSRRWLLWAGHRWKPDRDGSIRREWIAVLGKRYEEALGLVDSADRKKALASVNEAGASNASIEGGLALASSMLPIATTGDEWDTDAYLLGCENGVVDLRTGELRDGRPEDMISRSTLLDYDPTAECPRWIRFLDEVFAGDQELIAWFGRFIGSSAIGSAREEVLGLHHGGGSNGKSVCFRSLLRVFGDYGVTLSIESLTNATRRAGAATPDTVVLRNARLAYAAEPDQASRMSGGALKRLVSIDQQSGRALHQNQQTWIPTHSLHIATNHLPNVTDASDGFWRRIASVPWAERFRQPGDDGDGPLADPDLGDILAAEAPGTLAWVVRGAVAVANGAGLHPFPAAVTAKTAAYRLSEDRLGEFDTARLVHEPGAHVKRVDLFAAYLNWCENEQVDRRDRFTRNKFYAEAEARWGESRKPDKDYVFFDIRLHTFEELS